MNWFEVGNDSVYWLLSGDQVASTCTDRAEDPLGTALVVALVSTDMRRSA
jgi:hypothetical protein